MSHIYHAQTDSTARISKTDLFGAASILLVCHAILAYSNGVFSGQLLDTDAYMWLNRVLFLHQNGEWFETIYPRINPPLGHEQHWTRPFDLLLYAGGILASPFAGFDKGLHAWAVIVGPLLATATLVAMLWAVLPIFNQQQRESLGIIFACQAALYASFLAGRADHQILLLFLTTLLLGFVLRLLLTRFSPSMCIAAGMCSALALWVSIESALVVAISFTALSLAWLVGINKSEKKLAYYSVSFLASLLIAILLQKGPSDFFSLSYDQISIFYLTAAAITALLWSLVYLLSHLNNFFPAWPLRLTLLCMGTMTLGVILQWLFPGFLHGPLQSVDELYRTVRLEKIRELQPIISAATIAKEGWWQSSSSFIFWLGISIPATAALVLLLKRSHGATRLVWLYITLGSVVFSGLAIGQIRWVGYAVLYLLPAYAWLIAYALDHFANHVTTQRLPWVRVGFYGVVILWTYTPTLFLTQGEVTNNSTETKSSLKQLTDYLHEVPTISDSPKLILAQTDLGPELLYRTKHSVLSIPNHRYQPGFKLSYNILTAKKEEKAYKLIANSGVDLILLRKDYDDRQFYAGSQEQHVFYDVLESEEPPYWLEQITLPEKLARSFILYRMKVRSADGR